MIAGSVTALAAVVALAGCAGGGTVHGPIQIPSPTAAPTTSALVPVANPAYIDIPKLAAHSTLEPLGLNPDHTLAVPDVRHPRQAAWFDKGPKPGAVGPAIISAHINGGNQEGLFAHLGQLVQGDTFTIGLVDGRVLTFKVYKVLDMPKTTFDTAAVYSDTAGPEVRLISCFGSFDSKARSYRDNLVVKAKLVT